MCHLFFQPKVQTFDLNDMIWWSTLKLQRWQVQRVADHMRWWHSFEMQHEQHGSLESPVHMLMQCTWQYKSEVTIKTLEVEGTCHYDSVLCPRLSCTCGCADGHVVTVICFRSKIATVFPRHFKPLVPLQPICDSKRAQSSPSPTNNSTCMSISSLWAFNPIW